VERVISVFSGLPIRLSSERWSHITEEHPELNGKEEEVLETIFKPQKIYEGSNGELLATREIEPGKYIIVVYKEQSPEGFIITAFYTRRIRALERRKQIW
jgi:hypothetical protein